ncbi:hypothetical protein ABDJ85_02935 [Roseateles sp. DJS-2-20]|jgi:hypothetical protein|uniref:Uncharacterized protein n=1 Tax=Roseateles paludis TaxID=3145238 RepID=A0ABV0FXJ8_9BURK
MRSTACCDAPEIHALRCSHCSGEWLICAECDCWITRRGAEVIAAPPYVFSDGAGNRPCPHCKTVLSRGALNCGELLARCEVPLGDVIDEGLRGFGGGRVG